MITDYHIKKMSPQLLVNNIEQSIEFYIQKLGFIIDFRYEDFYAGISKDGCSIHLKCGKSSAEERKSKKDNEDLDIIFSVDAIENLYEALLNESIEVVQPLRLMPYGKEFYIADPDGHVISFWKVYSPINKKPAFAKASAGKSGEGGIRTHGTV
ncbi:MAG TPA: VOC family protein [Chitinophagaceae bacterium]|nr:VOC family protein [Chitinophagaceae bacterium]